jgi:hypothetical protein
MIFAWLQRTYHEEDRCRICENIGKFTGPAVFSATYALTHSYNIAFALLAIPSLIAIGCLRAQQRRPENKRQVAAG